MSMHLEQTVGVEARDNVALKAWDPATFVREIDELTEDVMSEVIVRVTEDGTTFVETAATLGFEPTDFMDLVATDDLVPDARKVQFGWTLALADPSAADMCLALVGCFAGSGEIRSRQRDVLEVALASGDSRIRMAAVEMITSMPDMSPLEQKNILVGALAREHDSKNWGTVASAIQLIKSS